MANLPSSKKRIKQNERNHVRNRARKSVLKSETRKLMDILHDGKTDAAAEQLRKLNRKIDIVAAKGTLHRNAAARRKSRLAKRVNAAANPQ